MERIRLPLYDATDNPTGCCPRFNPEGWDKQELHFKNKPFVKAVTRNFFHIPMNMGQVFSKTYKAIEEANAVDMEQFVVLFHDISPWKSEHLFAVTKEVPGEEMAYLNGDFQTRMFEGPYKEAEIWYHQMDDEIGRLGGNAEVIYFFYTTCPKCAKYYGKNYVAGFAKVSNERDLTEVSKENEQ